MRIDPASNRRMITDVNDAVSFIQGGNARVTFVSTKTAARFTYRVAEPKNGMKGDILFVSVMSGRDNESSFTYIGFLRGGEFHRGRKSAIAENATCVRAFAYVWNALREARMPAQCEVWHEGRCCRCGRALTVPASIARGIGPECASRGTPVVDLFSCDAVCDAVT